MQTRAQPSPWWHPANHADRRPFLLARNRIVASLRGWFESEGFIEVEPAILQVSPGNETHLHAFATELSGPDGARRPVYLHTSPEFACKKLVAAGERRIFTFAPAFRNRERGALHHPAFTMLEWYRAEESYETLMQDCAHILSIAATAGGASELHWRGRAADPFKAPTRMTVAEAFACFAGIDLLATLADDGRPNRHALAASAAAAGIRVSEDHTWADIFSLVLVERIEPRLGDGTATILTEYPACAAALARRKPSDARVAERFELYACGVELCNAFGELTDAQEQRRRFEAEMDEKQRIYGERYPVDEDFLSALAQMPPASGAALGLERLVMLCTGATDIEQVVWTPLVQP
ncbi:MAG: EF-P lysine aminoacylase GenX [Hyphomicrobiaceae bacterium]|nr:MAG: EF-P lysine aminoacylase GenX [Hyphomicrobiaceae bacterium]